MKTTKIFFILFFLLTIQSFSQNYTILISFDGFRWDYSLRGITPTLDSLKANGVHAISLRPNFPSKTFPNHLSIVTGMYCDMHGIISNNFTDAQGNWYSMGNDTLKVESQWYKGETIWETLEKNKIITASYFWPGSDINDSTRRSTYYQLYEHNRPNKKRIDDIIKLLQLPYKKRPKFLDLYFHETDDYGHDFGPNSIETNQAIQRMDSLVEYLYNGFTRIGLKDSINVIIVSDHGMTNIYPDKFIDVENILHGLDCVYQDYGPFMTINSKPENINKIYKKLKENENHFKVYKKENIPNYFHYKRDKNIYPIILSAELGWSLIADNNAEWLKDSKGNHGYENNYIDMHGTFIAAGPDFKKGYETGTLWNIDIYPLLCKMYNVTPNKNIDGKLERIGFVLKDK